MLPPFEIIHCSWPYRVEQHNECWVSEPYWDAPAMPYRPQPTCQMMQDEPCWMIDWRAFFKLGLDVWQPELCGEMRNFHVVFHLRVRQGGTLVFWDDDGCVIRRNGSVVHHDPSAHMLTRHELAVGAGDVLEVAHWQCYGGWLWGATVVPQSAAATVDDTVARYLPRVCRRLATPDGPPLKYYSHGGSPHRAIIALYSLILNGYAPSQVLLYGEHQWSAEIRDLFARAFPFATVVPTSEVFQRIQAFGGQQLSILTQRHWWVFKTCLALLCPPSVFGLMDDDVFILDSVTDAVRALDEYDLVYAQDTDHSRIYQRAWGWIHRQPAPPATGRFNAGLYWARVVDDPARIAQYALRVHPRTVPAYVWEQGFLACLYAVRRTWQLPSQRYFYPLFEGLPGGVLGYDYALNPCGFASIHYGGLKDKPSEAVMGQLGPEVLGRSAVA